MGRKLDYAIKIELDDEVMVERLVLRCVCANCGALYHINYDPPTDLDT